MSPVHRAVRHRKWTGTRSQKGMWQAPSHVDLTWIQQSMRDGWQRALDGRKIRELGSWPIVLLMPTRSVEDAVLG